MSINRKTIRKNIHSNCSFEVLFGYLNLYEENRIQIPLWNIPPTTVYSPVMIHRAETESLVLN